MNKKTNCSCCTPQKYVTTARHINQNRNFHDFENFPICSFLTNFLQLCSRFNGRFFEKYSLHFRSWLSHSLVDEKFLYLASMLYVLRLQSNIMLISLGSRLIFLWSVSFNASFRHLKTKLKSCDATILFRVNACSRSLLLIECFGCSFVVSRPSTAWGHSVRWSFSL